LGKNFDPAVERLRRAAGEAETKDPARAGDLIKLVEAQLAAIGRGDLQAAVDQATDDVELQIFAPPEFGWIRVARGRADFLEAIRHNFASVTDQRPEIATVVSQENTVVMIGRERGVITATGVPYDVEFVHRFTFRDGALAALRIIAARA
jgi:ketosteroid isomerase-like protein